MPIGPQRTEWSGHANAIYERCKQSAEIGRVVARKLQHGSYKFLTIRTLPMPASGPTLLSLLKITKYRKRLESPSDLVHQFVGDSLELFVITQQMIETFFEYFVQNSRITLGG